VWQACPMQLPFGPCTQQHFQNHMVPVRGLRVCLTEIAAMLPCLVIMHLQPAEKTVADCKFPSIALQLMAQAGF